MINMSANCKLKIFIVFLVIFGFFNYSHSAETYPNKEIRLIIAAGPGGNDRTARSVARFLPKYLGVSVLAENIPAAGGKVAMRQFMKLPADGYTIFFYHNPGITNIIQEEPGLLKFEDLVYINIQSIEPSLLIARKDTGWNSIHDMIEAARKNPGKYAHALVQPTAPSSIFTKILYKKLDLHIKLVPHGGGGAARASYMGNHTQLTGGGDLAMLEMKDISVPMAIYWDKPTKMWPDAPPINKELARYNVEMPIGGVHRAYALKSEFRKRYPDRWTTLVDAFEKVFKDKEFIEFTDKAEVGNDWYGPEESIKMMQRMHNYFMDIDITKLD